MKKAEGWGTVMKRGLQDRSYQNKWSDEMSAAVLNGCFSRNAEGNGMSPGRSKCSSFRSIPRRIFAGRSIGVREG